MKRILTSLVLTVVSWSACAQTNSATVRTMSLAECLTEALQHNFDVQIERYQPQLSLYDLHLAYSGYDPVFNLGGAHSHDDKGGLLLTNGIFITDKNSFNSGLKGGTPWGMTYDLSGNVADTYGSGGQGSSGSAGVSLTQPLLKNFWTDDARRTISVAKNRLKFSEQALRQQFITTVTDVENAYYELIYSRENRQVQQEALELAETQFNQDKTRVELGSLAAFDLQQDQAQVASSQAALIAAQFKQAKAENALKNLITDNYPQWHAIELQPTESLNITRQLLEVQDSWNKGLTQRPDLLEAKLNVAQQGIQLRYFQNQVFPELDLLGSYGVNGAGQEFNNALGQEQAGNRPFYSYGAQLSVPLGNGTARNKLKSGRVTEKQLLLQLKQLEQNALVQIDNAVKQAQSAWEGAEASRQARIYAEAALDAEQKKYAVGKSTTFTVLQLQNNLTSARSQEIRGQADYQEALANLAQQEGCTLERRKLDLQVK